MSRLPMPRFNLKVPKSKSETLILLVFRYRGHRLVYSTSLNILPLEWDVKSQRPFGKERRPDLWAIRRQLDDLSAYCRSIYIEHDYGAISPKEFKSLLDEKSGKSNLKEETPRISFMEFMDSEIDKMEAQGVRESSLKPYRVHANVIREFIEECGVFEFEEVDWSFRFKLIDFLATRQIKLSYGNKTLSIFRQFMERARRKQLHNNNQYQGGGWTVTQKKAIGAKVILSPSELEVLSEMTLRGYLKKVRDLFLIGAGTGQCYSDYSRYKPHHFYKTEEGIPILSMIAQKTDIPAKVPLNIFPWLLPILEEYQYSSPSLSMQKLNEGIKILGKKAGFEDKMLSVEQLMGRKPRVVKNYLPKYELLTTHTCRRSFATNLYRMGHSLGQIMPMTGHTTEGHLRTYIGIDAEENAIQVANSIIRKRNN